MKKAPKRMEMYLYIKAAMAFQFQPTNEHVKPVRLIEFQPTIIINVHVKLIFD